MNKILKLIGRERELFTEDIHYYEKELSQKVSISSFLVIDRKQRDEFLKFTNDNGIMTRPIWTLMNRLEMFKDCQCADLTNYIYLEDRVVNVPSSVRV